MRIAPATVLDHLQLRDNASGRWVKWALMPPGAAVVAAVVAIVVTSMLGLPEGLANGVDALALTAGPSALIALWFGRRALGFALPTPSSLLWLAPYGLVLAATVALLPDPRLTLAAITLPAVANLVLGVIIEEATFRGAVPPWLAYLPWFRSEVAVALVSSLLFAALHRETFLLTVPLFFSGLTLYALRWRTQSVLPPTLAHVSINVVGLAFSVGTFDDAAVLRVVLGRVVLELLFATAVVLKGR